MSFPEAQRNLISYHVIKWLLVSPTLHGCFRLRIYGQELIPQDQPFIAVASHASNLDPPIIANCLGRPTAFMAKEELFTVPVLGEVIRWYGAFPVKRGAADRAALRSALEALEAGWAVGLFIQGTRTLDGHITEAQPGAVLLASKANVPLLPVSVWGSGDILPKGAKFPKFAPVTVRFGQPIAPPQSSHREELNQVSQHCARAINDLLDLGR